MDVGREQGNAYNTYDHDETWQKDHNKEKAAWDKWDEGNISGQET